MLLWLYNLDLLLWSLIFFWQSPWWSWRLGYSFWAWTWDNHEDYGSFLSKLSSPAILHHIVPVSALPDLPAVLREDSMGESQLRVTIAFKECGLHTATSFTSMESKVSVLLFRWKMIVYTTSSHTYHFSFGEQFLCVWEKTAFHVRKPALGQ